MPDITMCEGKDCPIKETCYKFKAITNPFRQSYFMETPYNFSKNKCDHFVKIIENENNKNRKTL